MGKNFKVLFVYYNPRKMSLVPPAIAIFSSLLKAIGAHTDLFDTTLYNKQEGSDADSIEEQTLTVKPFSGSLAKIKDKIKYKDGNVHNGFKRKVNEFSPDLIVASVVESTFEGSIHLLKNIRQLRIPTIIGGVFPTLCRGIVPMSSTRNQ